MINRFLTRLKHNFHRWCYVHLAVSTFSFLILVCQGIPFCILGFIGNVIFNPVLAFFLCLSALLFFTEMFCIPNGYIMYCMELVSRAWLFVLNLSTDVKFEIPCAQPSPVIMATVLCGAIVIILLKTSYLRKNICFILLLCGSFFISQQQVDTYCTEDLACAKELLHIIKHTNQLIIIDPGCLGRYLSAPSYVQYTLLPHLIQKYGTHTIDHLILLKPGKLVFDAVLALLQRATIKNLYIPLWQGNLSKSGIYAFMRLKEKAALCDMQIHRLSQREMYILHDAHSTLSIKPLGTQIKKGPIQFNAFCICHTIDKQSVTFYPSQYNS